MLFTKNFKNVRFKKKLFYKFTKSFEIKNVVESQTYRLCLFDQWRIHFIFHVSLLKSYYINANIVLSAEIILVSEDEKYKVKNILKIKRSEKNFIISCVERNFSSVKIIEFSNIIWQMRKICSNVITSVNFSSQWCLRQRSQDFEYERKIFWKKNKAQTMRGQFVEQTSTEQ